MYDKFVFGVLEIVRSQSLKNKTKKYIFSIKTEKKKHNKKQKSTIYEANNDDSY